jgi:hypothetical protein
MKNMDDKKSMKELHDEHREEYWAMKNWRAWGSWFSWGSPVGLGLFFISIAAALWILAQAGLIGSK